MSQGVPKVSCAEVAIASGILGAGVGYILAPRKYDLEQLITQEPDIFEKSIQKKTLVAKCENALQAYKLIEKARKDYFKALINNAGDAKLTELLKMPTLASAYKNIKTYIPKAKTQYAILIGASAAFITTAISYITNPRN